MALPILHYEESLPPEIKVIMVELGLRHSNPIHCDTAHAAIRRSRLPSIGTPSIGEIEMGPLTPW
jgi:hypothetical protein